MNSGSTESLHTHLQQVRFPHANARFLADPADRDLHRTKTSGRFDSTMHTLTHLLVAKSTTYGDRWNMAIPRAPEEKVDGVILCLLRSSVQFPT